MGGASVSFFCEVGVDIAVEQMGAHPLQGLRQGVDIYLLRVVQRHKAQGGYISGVVEVAVGQEDCADLTLFSGIQYTGKPTHVHGQNAVH